MLTEWHAFWMIRSVQRGAMMAMFPRLVLGWPAAHKCNSLLCKRFALAIAVVQCAVPHCSRIANGLGKRFAVGTLLTLSGTMEPDG